MRVWKVGGGASSFLCLRFFHLCQLPLKSRSPWLLRSPTRSLASHPSHLTHARSSQLASSTPPLRTLTITILSTTISIPTVIFLEFLNPLGFATTHTIHTRKMAHRVSQLACVFVLVALMTISLAPSTMTQAPCGQPCQNSNQCGGTCTWCNNGVCSRGKPCNSPVRITRDHTRTRACLTR